MLETRSADGDSSAPVVGVKKKLIEVALPLQAINKASAREKSIRHGHPSTLHLWWARRPLAACRAVLFASLVDDPSSHLDQFPTAEDQERERKRLFDLIERLVQWENSLNEHVLAEARAEIRKSVGAELPTVYDPFCGGGAIPIEAQRLGLPTLASDLNPVAVLITKALTEIPWRFKGHPPVHATLRGPLQKRSWERATGLAADVEAYGTWILDEARRRIGSYYPQVQPAAGGSATVIAWLWARTVRCPNPLCGAEMPLIKSFALSTKRGKEWSIEPVVDRSAKTVAYSPRAGKPSRDGTVTRRGAQCIVCNEPVTLAYIRTEGKARRIGSQMTAIVAEGQRGRLYLPPDEGHVSVAQSATPAWAPDTDLPERALGFRVQGYGMTKHRDLFTPRQLLALTTFSDLVRECREPVLSDAKQGGTIDDAVSLEGGGNGARAYADAVSTFLAMALDRLVDYGSSLSSWNAAGEKMRNTFNGQKMSMTWDFAEVNPFSDSSGNFGGALEWVKKTVAAASTSASAEAFARDAAVETVVSPCVACTDPPYYANAPYADLSDFFYVWLRRTLGSDYPDLLGPLLVPKGPELVVDPFRFAGSRNRAKTFFENGMCRAFEQLRISARSEYPTTVFYAYKQSEGDNKRHNAASAVDAVPQVSEGWEAMLDGLLSAGFQIVGTWPVRSEFSGRQRNKDSNALGSSIVLTCRPRSEGARVCTRSDFIRDLRQVLQGAVRQLRDASLAAADLEQAAIGPGMSAFSGFTAVLEPDGSRMSVGSALALISSELTQILLGEIVDIDAESQFALSWFASHAYSKGRYDEAEVRFRARNTSLIRLERTGVLQQGRGVVALVSPRNLRNGTAGGDNTLRGAPAWAQLMHLIGALIAEEGGTETAGALLSGLTGNEALHVKNLAYHCYVASSGLKRASEAQDFNDLVDAWPAIERASKSNESPTLL